MRWPRVNPLVRSITACASILAIGALPAPSLAGALTVAPIRIEVAPDQTFCSLKVGNDAAQEVTVQLRGYRWRQQPDGEDALEAAPEFAINPSIVTLPAGNTRLVRCSLPAPAGAREDTFRLLVSELPRDTPSAGTLSTLLQISIPVFRADPAARPLLLWSKSPFECAKIVNDGSAHARIVALSLYSRDGEPLTSDQGFYLLAGASRPIGECDGNSGVDRVDVTLADGSIASLDQKPVNRQ